MKRCSRDLVGALAVLLAVLLAVALAVAPLAGCTATAAVGDGGAAADAATDGAHPDGATDAAADSAGGCGPATCASGCCTGGSCVVPPFATACGSGGASCVDCSADPRADSCASGGCVCAAAGARCPEGQFCYAAGCRSCQPDCAGKCAGADDGCVGTCPANGCTGGCCTADKACLAYASQGGAACGFAGAACASCTLAGRACDAALHTCMSSRANDALFVAVDVPAVMTPGQNAAVFVTMRNIGTATWTAATAYKLGSQNLQDNGTWALSRVELGAGDAVTPGQEHTFTFAATAPATAGLYNFQWRMLRESVEWFGEHSAYRPVVVGGGTVGVCEAMRALANTSTDAAPALQACIAAAAAGSTVELPAGVYRIDSAITVASVPLTLRTEGKSPDAARCAVTLHDCAELAASTSFAGTGGILQLLVAGSRVDHLVVNGNKAMRAATASGTQCAGGSNSYGYNLRVACNGCALTNSVTKNALCGTGCEVSGAGSGVVLWRNAVADNGVHDAQGMWSDGVTVHDYAASTFVANDFIDNTDVDFIFGGCQACVVQDNTVTHTAAFAGGSFAALMIHAWPSGATSGNFVGTDTSRNSIDCGPSRRCGFGLYVGPDAWYDADTFGGAVHHNVVANAQQGVLIDDAHDMQVWNNHVSNPAASTLASCGTKTTSAHAIGNSSSNIDRSADTMGAVYTNVNFDGCVPNWWH
jgi:hypothetical protein